MDLPEKENRTGGYPYDDFCPCGCGGTFAGAHAVGHQPVYGAAVTRNFAASLFRNIKYFTLRKLYLCRKWMQKRLQKTTTTGITLPNFDFLA